MRGFFATFIFMAISCRVVAEDVTIENSGFTELPKEARKLIAPPKGWKDEACQPVGQFINLTGSDAHSGLFVTTKNSCGAGSAAGPVWLLKRRSTTYDIVLDEPAYRVTLKDTMHKGLRDITTSEESAGNYEIQFWSYNGKTYRKTKEYVFRADDKKSCEEHPDICPFHF